MIYSKTITSVALSALLLMGMTGCSDDSDTYFPIQTPAADTPVAEATISPYQRVAIIPGTWADVNAIATKISQMAIYSNESVTLGYPSNWVIAGANLGGGETDDGLADHLPIPAIGGKAV